MFDASARSGETRLERNPHVETLILFGTSDHVLYPDFDRMAVEVFPNHVGPFLLRDCGHFVPWEAPDQLVGAVRVFCRDLLPGDSTSVDSALSNRRAKGFTVAEVEIGIGKSGRRAYGFDDIAIVPSRRTRDPEDVDISWEIDAFRFDLPLMARGDGRRRQPATAIEIGKLGGVGGAQPRGPLDPLRRSRAASSTKSPNCRPTRPRGRMQEVYSEPIKPELIGERIREIERPASSSCAVAHAAAHRGVRQGHPRRRARPPRHPGHGCLRRARLHARSSRSTSSSFVRELQIPVIVGGCASYQAALHLMRTGAAGILVGVGPGHACTTRGVLGIGVPQATAIADARAARMRHLDETGVYVT